jgi:hypothetical protein
MTIEWGKAMHMENTEMLNKKMFELILKLYNQGIVCDNEIIPVLQRFILTYGPLDESNEIMKEFIVKFRGEE